MKFLYEEKNKLAIYRLYRHNDYIVEITSQGKGKCDNVIDVSTINDIFLFEKVDYDYLENTVKDVSGNIDKWIIESKNPTS